VEKTLNEMGILCEKRFVVLNRKTKISNLNTKIPDDLQKILDIYKNL
jgi:hypothetical protein